MLGDDHIGQLWVQFGQWLSPVRRRSAGGSRDGRSVARRVGAVGGEVHPDEHDRKAMGAEARREFGCPRHRAGEHNRVERARDALVESVRRSLYGNDGAVLRASHTQVFESLDPDGTRLTTLAERARMSHQAMGEMVDELTRHGYLERVPDPADGRARLIRPTKRGQAVLARAADQLRLLHDRWQRELPRRHARPGGRGAPDVHPDLRGDR